MSNSIKAFLGALQVPIPRVLTGAAPQPVRPRLPGGSVGFVPVGLAMRAAMARDPSVSPRVLQATRDVVARDGMARGGAPGAGADCGQR